MVVRILPATFAATLGSEKLAQTAETRMVMGFLAASFETRTTSHNLAQGRQGRSKVAELAQGHFNQGRDLHSGRSGV